MKTIAFAGGGTGGHIFPIKSLIENIDKSKYQILWFGNRNSLEEKISQELKNKGYNIIFLSVLSGKIRRGFSFKNLYLNTIDLCKNLIGFFQSFFFILKYNPDFIFSKGGFVAFNPSLVGNFLGKKIYLHESDTIPGLVNKMVSKFADYIFVGFEYSKKYFKNKKIQVVGQIISSKFYQEKGIYENNGKTNLLIIGGSQGSKIIIEGIKKLLDNGKLQEFNIFIVGGLLNKNNIFEKYKNVKFFGFLSQDELIDLYKKTDISITRGSATSLAEQDQFDIKKIIVPLPFTGGNHQYFNALEYQKKGDILISQLDKDFLNKLEAKLKKLSNYKKIEGSYRKNTDNKQIILDKILN